MRTIYLNSQDRELSFDDFKKQFIDICLADRKQDKALAFAFILYDFSNPQISRILNDTNYWLALHSLSGKYLTVFSLNYKSPKQKLDHLKPEPTRSFMTSFSHDMNPSEGSNELVEKYFGSGLKIKYPAILFFQVNDSRVIDSLLIQLGEEKIEESFLELKDYIKKTADLLKNIDAENKNNYQEIFDLIEKEVKVLSSSKKMKRVTKDAGNIISLISAIKTIFI